MILSSPGFSGHRFQEVVDGFVSLEGVAELGTSVDRVGVSSTDLADPNDAGCLEFGDDAVHSSLGDPHSVGDLADE